MFWSWRTSVEQGNMSKKMSWAKLVVINISASFLLCVVSYISSFPGIRGVTGHVLELLLCDIMLELKLNTICSLRNFLKNERQQTENQYESCRSSFSFYWFSQLISEILCNNLHDSPFFFFRKKSWRKPFWWCLQISRTWNRPWLPQKWQTHLAYRLWRTENGRYSKHLQLKAQDLMKQWNGNTLIRILSLSCFFFFFEVGSVKSLVW